MVEHMASAHVLHMLAVAKQTEELLCALSCFATERTLAAIPSFPLGESAFRKAVYLRCYLSTSFLGGAQTWQVTVQQKWPFGCCQGPNKKF